MFNSTIKTQAFLPHKRYCGHANVAFNTNVSSVLLNNGSMIMEMFIVTNS